MLIQGAQALTSIFADQFNWASTITFKWASNNAIDPGGPGSLNLIFANQFKWALYNNI